MGVDMGSPSPPCSNTARVSRLRSAAAVRAVAHAQEEPESLLLLSGFYTSDIDDLLGEAARYNLAEVRRDEREQWAALLLKKLS